MKQTRLLEIIREEIAGALNEAGLGDQITALEKAKEAIDKTKFPIIKKESDVDIKLADLKKKQAEEEVKSGAKLEEAEQLDEMAFALVKGLNPSEDLEPRYKKENFKKVVDLILSKVDGKKTTSDIAKELGVIQQQINHIVSDLIIAGILEKGEVESKAGKNIDNKPGPKAKSEPKTKSEPKAKTATLTKGDDGLDSVDSSDADNDKEATQNIGSDPTAKKLGKVATGKEETFNRILGLVEKYKDDKDKVDAYINKAENEYKLSKTLLDQLKRVAGRDVKI